ncbi:unnamed protein product [Heligmosomoides polygyrus]|uniref:F-box protein n=1 Tax=Heligmosomoides polygyrus TaxID=6339 RepID=A0A183G3Y9_HELPZ|nr:unnamed protein product [Heligmosomoides polygyrus]
MNPNIIYNLCPYLDVKSMLCLSAAYPQWSAIVHDYLKKKFWKLQLMDFVSMCGSFDPVILLSRTGRVECKAKREQWEIIPVSYWKYVPFEVLNISSMEIYQFDVSKDGTIHFPDEMFDMLTRVTTRLHHVCGIATAFPASGSDGLQRVAHFEGKGPCQAPPLPGGPEGISASGADTTISR